MIKFFRSLLFKKETKPRLVYTWNGLNPEVLRNNWIPGDEYWVLVWWKHFNAQSLYLGPLTQQEEETMNDNLKTDLNTPTFKPVPAAPLTDAELEKLLATKSVADLDEAVYITDADETADEPTIH